MSWKEMFKRIVSIYRNQVLVSIKQMLPKKLLKVMESREPLKKDKMPKE